MARRGHSKAQAVAARTYAMLRAESRSKQSYQLDSTTQDQVYRWQSKQHEVSVNVLSAINATRGLILENKNGLLFNAYYHADCGGETEVAKNVWGEGDSLGTTHDVHCPLNPLAHWRLTMSAVQITNLLKKGLRAASVTELRGIEVVDRSKSGRVQHLLLTVDTLNGLKKLNISGQDFRQVMGFDKLRSTLFLLNRHDGEITFTGRGYGHGVGMCQWGAKQLAKEGHDFREILSHYYPQAHLHFRGDARSGASRVIRGNLNSSQIQLPHQKEHHT